MTAAWLPLGVALLLGACGPSELADCPEPGALPFSLTCDAAARQCTSEQMRLGVLGPLNVSSEAVAIVPWDRGVLRIAPKGLGGVEAQGFDETLFERGPTVPLLPPLADTQHVAIQAQPLPEGAVAVILEQDPGTGRHRLLMVRLVRNASTPEVGPLRLLWEGEHLGPGAPRLFSTLDAATDTLFVALDVVGIDGGARVHFVRAALAGTQAPRVFEWNPPLDERSRLLGLVAAGEDAGLLLAGAVESAKGETLWIDRFTSDFEREARLWQETSEAAPTSASLISTPDGAGGAFGWFMPSPGEGLLAGLHRLEGLGEGLFPTRTDIWMGPYFGPLQGGIVEQALAFEGDQLVQLSLELGPESPGASTLLGTLRMDAGDTAFNPWGFQPPLRVPAADHRLRAQSLPDKGILATVPLLEDDGSHTLGLFRICLPL